MAAQQKGSDESSPLLQRSSLSSYTFSVEEGLICEGEDDHQDLKAHGIVDTMSYSTKSLTSWEAFGIRYTTVWCSPDLWKMMMRLTLVAMFVAFVTVAVLPNPAAMKVAKFTSVSKFLNVVVGLLLGFFLSSSMNRWYSCVNGFLELLDAIRNMQMQLVALGVPEKESNLCLRYGFASAWLLYSQLLIEAKHQTTHEQSSKDRDEMWRKFTSQIARIDPSGTQTLLEHDEEKVLRLTRDPPGMMWMWVAALIGRMAQDGWIPPMASPTYGRVMNLCQSAHGGIRQVRAAISVQAPLTYTHMLATLVHVNNLLNAMTFGVVSGVATGVALQAGHQRIYGHPIYHAEATASNRQATQDWQNMAVTFLYCFFGPLLYQALLLIAMHLAQPFDSVEARIPLDRLLNQLEIDMVNGRDVLEAMPFERPCFKPQPPREITPRIQAAA